MDINGVLIGRALINGPFFIAMFDYRRVIIMNEPCQNPGNHTLAYGSASAGWLFPQLGEMGFDPSKAQAQDPRLNTDSPQSFWSFWHGAPSMEVPPNHPKLNHLRIETHSDLGNLGIPCSKKSPLSADFYIRAVRHRTLVILGAPCLSASSTYELRNSVGFKVS